MDFEKLHLYGTISIVRNALTTIETASTTGSLTPQIFVALGLDVLLLIQPLFAGNALISGLIAEAIAILEQLSPTPPTPA